MPEIWFVAIVAVLVVIAALIAVLVVRTGAIARLREQETRESSRDGAELRTLLSSVVTQLAHVERDIRQDLANARTEQGQWASGLRGELAASLESVRTTVEQRLDVMRSDNATKLEQMRATVDEKLQATLE